MYILDRHQAPSPEHITSLIRAHPLGAIVVLTNSGLVANHIPLRLDTDCRILEGHVSTSNELAAVSDNIDALVLFQGPDHYISPSWCPSKLNEPEIVPTWNYAVAHVSGRLWVIRDSAWLRAHLEVLTTEQEHFIGRDWRIKDAPESFLQRMLGKIVGIEIHITDIIGKWKTTVVQPQRNADAVATILDASGRDTAQAMAALIRERTSVQT